MYTYSIGATSADITLKDKDLPFAFDNEGNKRYMRDKKGAPIFDRPFYELPKENCQLYVGYNARDANGRKKIDNATIERAWKELVKHATKDHHRMREIIKKIDDQISTDHSNGIRAKHVRGESETARNKRVVNHIALLFNLHSGDHIDIEKYKDLTKGLLREASDIMTEIETLAAKYNVTADI